MTNVLIYGATGYTGQLFIKEMIKQGHQPILAGRSNAVKEIAQQFGCTFAVFGLEVQSVIIENLKNIDLVVNLAGPFQVTQKPLIEACLASQCHYIDIAGEVDEMASAFQFDSDARKAGIMIMPGSGFGVVPTDIAANIVKDALPDATTLTLAYATEGGASRGTLKTVLKNIETTGFRQVNNKLVSAKPAESRMKFTVDGKSFNAVYNPWRADLFTAGLSTKISNIETFSVFPGFIVSMMQGKRLWLRDLLVKKLLRFFPEGPTDKQLQKGATYIFAMTKNEKNETSTVTIKGPEAYLFTVYCLTAITKEILAKNYQPGFQTPAYYGRTLLSKIDTVDVM